MSTSTQKGYLMLADISGYTSFVAGTELEHAQAILSELLELIFRQFRTRLTISKIEGDAVFAYTPSSSVQRGEVLLELIESTYTAFRDRRDLAARRTTCECRACRAIPNLDLKILLHCGEYYVQDIAGTQELVGSDVNLIHRLLKNQVSEKTGWRGYALFTQQGLDQLAVRPADLHQQSEAYEHLGKVQTYSLDLNARYIELATTRHIVVEPVEAHSIVEFDYAAPPPVIWEWFNEPAKRGQWMHSQIVPILRVAGRNGSGARNHCIHGKDQIIIEDVLDYHPFDYFTVAHTPRNTAVSILMTYTFTPTEGGGTHLRLTLKAAGPTTPGLLAKPVCRLVVHFQLLRQWKLESLDTLISADEAAQAVFSTTAAP